MELNEIFEELKNDIALSEQLAEANSENDVFELCRKVDPQLDKEKFENELPKFLNTFGGIDSDELSRVAGGKSLNFGRKIRALLMIPAIFGSSAGMMSTSTHAYSKPGFFHVYTKQEVAELRDKALLEKIECQRIIDELKKRDSDVANIYKIRLEEEAKMLTSEHLLDRSNYADAEAAFETFKKIQESVKKQIENINKQAEDRIRQEKEEKLNKEKEEKLRKEQEERFRLEQEREKQRKEKEEKLRKEKEEKEKILKEQEEKLRKEQEEKEKVRKEQEEKLRKEEEKLRKEQEEKFRKEQEEKEKIRKEQEEILRREEELRIIKAQQDDYFASYKKELINSLNNTLRDLKFFLKNSKVSKEFEELADNSNQEALEIINVIADMSIGEHIRNENPDVFAANVENYFLEIKKKSEHISKKCDNLIKEIMEAQKELEKGLVNEARDYFDLQLQEISRELDADFDIKEIDSKDAETIKAIQTEIKGSFKKIQKLIMEMNSLAEKVNVEKEIKLFKGKLERSLSRKKGLTERYLARLKEEERLQNLRDSAKQNEMLRNKEINLNNVIGGYNHVKSTMLSFIDEYEFFQKHKKGIPGKGMVLFGKPGIGKTSTVMAVAAHKGIDIVILKKKTEIASMEHEIKAKFNEARTLAEGGQRLVILLIDEIDGLGATRMVGTTDKDTIALLAEIDALKPSDGVIIFSTTNQLKNVDEAIIRSGRLDQKLELARPTEADIKEILKVKLQGLRLEESVEINEFVDSVFSVFRDKTGADIDRAIQIAIQTKLQSSETKQLVDITLYRSDVIHAAGKLN